MGIVSRTSVGNPESLSMMLDLITKLFTTDPCGIREDKNEKLPVPVPSVKKGNPNMVNRFALNEIVGDFVDVVG